MPFVIASTVAPLANVKSPVRPAAAEISVEVPAEIWPTGVMLIVLTPLTLAAWLSVRRLRLLPDAWKLSVAPSSARAAPWLPG